MGMGTDPNPPRDVPVSVDHDRWYAEAVASRWEAPDPPGRDITVRSGPREAGPDAEAPHTAEDRR